MLDPATNVPGYTPAPTPVPDPKHTPKKVMTQVRLLLFVTIFIGLILIVLQLMQLGSLNQTYKHITQTQANTKQAIIVEQDALSRTQEVILDKLDDNKDKGK